MNEFFRVSSDVVPPKYATEEAACFDVCAYIKENTQIKFRYASNIDFIRIIKDGKLFIASGERVLVPTGLHFNIDSGYELKLYARSGIPWKYNITVHNGVGIIDSDYINELFVMLHNHSTTPFIINNGDRIAQAQFVKAERLVIKETIIKPTQKTNRTGGFGSTGVK